MNKVNEMTELNELLELNEPGELNEVSELTQLHELHQAEYTCESARARSRIDRFYSNHFVVDQLDRSRCPGGLGRCRLCCCPLGAGWRGEAGRRL